MPQTMTQSDKPKSVKDAHKAPVNKEMTPERKKALFAQMLRIRRFEERSVRSYQQGHIGGFCHTYIGQEALAVGTISVLGQFDHVITAYRDHAHALAVGMDMNSCMAEMYGKATGCSKGKGGSMHFFDPERNFWGGHGIVGGQTPLGAGIAFAIKYQEQKGACLCYLGDGAVNQGAVHEAYNLAALWKLPVIYIIENNGYSMGTSQARSSAGDPLTKRALAFDMDFDSCLAHDLYAVRATTQRAIERAHTESKPTLLEMKTYRYRGHSMSDPDQTYRTKDEIKAYKEKYDPIEHFKKILIYEKVLTEADAEQIDDAACEEADESVRFAQESPFPQAEDIQTDVYWELDNPSERKSQGRIFFNQAKES